MDLIRAGQAVAIPRQADTDDQLIITPDGNWQTSFWQLSYAGGAGNCAPFAGLVRPPVYRGTSAAAPRKEASAEDLRTRVNGMVAGASIDPVLGSNYT